MKIRGTPVIQSPWVAIRNPTRIEDKVSTRHPESNKQSPEMGTQFMILLCLLTMRRFC